MDNVVSLKVVREMKKATQEDPDYEAKILGADKLELLSEMMKFQEERTETGYLTPTMMVRGKILFKALEERAETFELRHLARSYRRHLKYELEAYYKTPLTPPEKNSPIKRKLK